MKSQKGLRIMAAMLGAVLALSLFGCSGGERPVSGGITDKTDPKAPKTIESKDITGFYSRFYLTNLWDEDITGQFEFSVAKNDSWELVASERMSGVSVPADEELLKALQSVIDSNKLAAKNGYYRITAGLPPEYQPCELTVDYASGERLTFTENNEPTAQWAADVFEVFADWFAAHGDDSLRPKESQQVSRLQLNYINGSRLYNYSDIDVHPTDAIDGEVHLFTKSVYDAQPQTTLAEEYVVFPEDFYEQITQITEKYGLAEKYFKSEDSHEDGYYGFGKGLSAGPEEDSEERSLEIYLEYEGGRVIEIDTKKPSEIEGLQGLLDELLAYMDSLFE